MRSQMRRRLLRSVLVSAVAGAAFAVADCGGGDDDAAQ
jgi:hypothetical protein